MNHIAVINESSLPDAEVQAMTLAVEQQVHRDFYPAWGISANFRFIPKGHKPPKGYWWLVMLDDADVAGALGYHDITPDGQPLGKVFVKTTLMAGGLVSVTLSHEAVEMLADPNVNLLVEEYPRFYAYEVADSVEADVLGYQINGIQVSDFVTPDYFETFRKSGTFSFKKNVLKPLPEMAPGGYLAFMENGRWQQMFAKSTEPPKLPSRMTTQNVVGGTATIAAVFASRPRSGSRRERRILGHQNWLPSTIESVESP